MGSEAEHRNDIRRYFEDAARQHTAGYTTSTRSGYLYCRRRDLVVETLAGIESGSLLDVGCGSGALEPICREYGYTYVGVDVSSEMIEAARVAPEVGADSVFDVGQVEHLDFPAESFEVVMALGVLEYIEPDQLDDAVEELVRVLAPGGTLVLALLNRSSPIWLVRSWRESLRRVVARLRRRPYQNRAPEILFSRAEVVSLLEERELSVVSQFGYSFALVPSRIYASTPRFWEAVAGRVEPLGAGPLGRIAMGHYVTAEKPARVAESQ